MSGELIESKNGESYVIEIEHEGAMREFKIFITEADVKEELDRQLDQMIPNANMSGFRKGTAPKHILRRRFGKELELSIRTQISTKLIEEQMKKTRKSVEPPNITMETCDADDISAEIVLTYEEMPEMPNIDFSKIKLTQYKVIENKKLIRIGREFLAHEFKRDQILNPDEESIEGDIVDFCVYRETEENDKSEMVLYSRTLIAGDSSHFLGDSVSTIGLKKGDTFVNRILVDENYPWTEYIGKECELTTKIGTITREQEPEFNINMINTLGFKDEVHFDEYCKGIAIDWFARETERILREDLEVSIIKFLDYDVPPIYRDNYINGFNQSQNLPLTEQNTSDAQETHDSVETTESDQKPEDLDISLESSQNEITRIFDNRLRYMLFNKNIAIENNLIGDEKIARQLLTENTKNTHPSVQDVERIRASLTLHSVHEYLIDHANVVTKEMDPDELYLMIHTRHVAQ